MKKKPSSRRQIELIIYAVIVVTVLAFLGLSIVIRNLVNIPVAFIYILLGPALVGALWLTQTLMEKSRYKEELDRMEKEIEAEEEKNERTGKTEKPDLWLIVLPVACTIIWSIVEGTGTVMDMVEAGSFIMFIPDMICSMTLFIIGLLLAMITFNVWKDRIFTISNCRIIYFIAFTLIVSVIIQMQYWDSTPMIPNATVGMYFLTLGTMAIFFGKLFEIMIKIKNDNDLTI